MTLQTSPSTKTHRSSSESSSSRFKKEKQEKMEKQKKYMQKQRTFSDNPFKSETFLDYAGTHNPETSFHATKSIRVASFCKKANWGIKFRNGCNPIFVIP